MIGVLGGTFDPVHYGHLRPALEVMAQTGMDEMRIIPCRQPPHRSLPQADPEQRLAMLHRALSGQAGFVVDEREMQRPGPSYMVDTLRSLREDFPGNSLSLVLGMDAFAALDSWHEWQALISLAHLVVTRRPGCDLQREGAVGRLLAQHRCDDVVRLHEKKSGCIYLCKVTQLDISATRIRRGLAQGENMRFLMPDAVIEYIDEQGLYRLASEQ